MTTKPANAWVSTETQLPPVCELVLMECLQPVQGSDLKKICYDLGFYVDEETEYRIDEDEHDLVGDLGTVDYNDKDQAVLSPGWYRVFDSWRGQHIQDPAGDVVRWMPFSRR